MDITKLQAHLTQLEKQKSQLQNKPYNEVEEEINVLNLYINDAKSNLAKLQ